MNNIRDNQCVLTFVCTNPYNDVDSPMITNGQCVYYKNNKNICKYATSSNIRNIYYCQSVVACTNKMVNKLKSWNNEIFKGDSDE